VIARDPLRGSARDPPRRAFGASSTVTVGPGVGVAVEVGVAAGMAVGRRAHGCPAAGRGL